MALAFKVSSLDAVPEALRSAYVQKDGAFILDVDGVVPADEIEGLKKNRDALKGEKQKLLDQMNALLESNKLTEEERNGLKARVDDLESQVLSKEELAAKTAKKVREEADREIEKIKGQAKHFESLFNSHKVQADITKAAQEAGAFSVDQIHGLLAPRTRLEPVMDDDGKPTGQYRSLTTVSVIDGEKRIEKDLPTSEAVGAFLSLPENKNLVDSKFRAGGGATGGRTSQGGAKTITRSQFDGMDAKSRMDFMKGGGQLTD